VRRTAAAVAGAQLAQEVLAAAPAAPHEPPPLPPLPRTGSSARLGVRVGGCGVECWALALVRVWRVCVR